MRRLSKHEEKLVLKQLAEVMANRRRVGFTYIPNIENSELEGEVGGRYNLLQNRCDHVHVTDANAEVKASDNKIEMMREYAARNLYWSAEGNNDIEIMDCKDPFFERNKLVRYMLREDVNCKMGVLNEGGIRWREERR